MKENSKERHELVTNWHQFKSLKHSSVMPRAFTEHGVAMLSSVLRSKKAIAINLFIIKTFIRMREILLTHREHETKLNELEQRVGKHDKDIQSIIAAIQQLLVQEEKPRSSFISYRKVKELRGASRARSPKQAMSQYIVDAGRRSHAKLISIRHSRELMNLLLYAKWVFTRISTQTKYLEIYFKDFT